MSKGVTTNISDHKNRDNTHEIICYCQKSSLLIWKKKKKQQKNMLCITMYNWNKTIYSKMMQSNKLQKFTF